MTVATLVPLQALALTLVAVAAVAVVLVRETLRQALVLGAYGLVLAILFVVFQAPDVALSMLVVGAIGYPLVVLVAVARARGREREPDAEREPD
jgi:uncharacterized MnhB-related membrane protein